MMPNPQADNALADAPQWPDLAQARFTHRSRGGYDEQEVDAYLDHLVEVIERAERHRGVLSDEVLRLRQNAIADHNAAQQGEVAAEAVQLLSKAQVIADKCVADAEQYARDLALTARSQYREVLERAEQSAEGTRQGLPASPTGVPELEYVRTYAQVAQVQLRSVLEALTEQVDKLGNTPIVTQEASGQRDISWDTPLFDATHTVEAQVIDLSPTSFRMADLP